MRVKHALKTILKSFNIDPSTLIEGVSYWSINLALAQQGMKSLVESLAQIVPDISEQYSGSEMQGPYWQLKVRALHAFQTSLMLKALAGLSRKRLTVVDIGDSAGTHMIYLTKLAGEGIELETISVNLDPKAVEKILAKGLKAILCRAECLDLGSERPIDLFTSFEMVEHLHNPAIFFRRLAKKSTGNLMVITVPYMRKSRVGLFHTRNSATSPVFAEDEHIFELSPQDWTLLCLHSGWRITYSETYYQYPRKLPLVSPLLASFWRYTDFEGFWGAILEKDTSCSDRYQDWEE